MRRFRLGRPVETVAALPVSRSRAPDLACREESPQQDVVEDLYFLSSLQHPAFMRAHEFQSICQGAIVFRAFKVNACWETRLLSDLVIRHQLLGLLS